MNKSVIHRHLKHLQSVSFGLLIGLFIISAVTTGLALRHNNIQALKLRDKVLEVDQKNGDVEAALKELRQYVHSHMNTNLASDNGIYPPIQLKYRYERLMAIEKDKVSKEMSRIYTEAQSACEKQFPQGLSGGGRVPCIQDYVTKHTVAEKQIPDSLYKFDFASPIWTPDLAGISLVLSGLLALLIVSRLIIEVMLRQQL